MSCHSDNTHPLARLDEQTHSYHAPEVDDEDTVTEDDSSNDGHTTKLALRHPTKFLESVAIKVSLVAVTMLNTF